MQETFLTLSITLFPNLHCETNPGTNCLPATKDNLVIPLDQIIKLTKIGLKIGLGLNQDLFC